MSCMFLRQHVEDRSAVHEESDYDENGDDDVDGKGNNVVGHSVCLGQLAVER